jgi:hypothetical protein
VRDGSFSFCEDRRPGGFEGALGRFACGLGIGFHRQCSMLRGFAGFHGVAGRNMDADQL